MLTEVTEKGHGHGLDCPFWITNPCFSVLAFNIQTGFEISWSSIRSFFSLILLEGALQMNAIEGSKVSANQSFNRASGHSPTFIVGNTFGKMKQPKSLFNFL